MREIIDSVNLFFASPALNSFPECLTHVQFLAFVSVWNTSFLFSFSVQFLSFLQIPVISYFPISLAVVLCICFFYNRNFFFFKPLRVDVILFAAVPPA